MHNIFPPTAHLERPRRANRIIMDWEKAGMTERDDPLVLPRVGSRFQRYLFILAPPWVIDPSKTRLIMGLVIMKRPS